MVGVRRGSAQAHGHEGRDRRHHVDDALQGVGEKRNAARDVIGGIFQDENKGSDEYAADGKFLNLVHGATRKKMAERESEATL